MKNIILVFALILSLNAFGQEMPVIKITNNDTEKEYRILFSSSTEQSVQVSLLDINGREVVKEVLNAKGFVKTFDLKQVTAGTYTWKIKFGRRTFMEEFDILSASEIARRNAKR